MSNFTGLEKLLIHCNISTRRAPSESGVRFSISPPLTSDLNSICLLYHVDADASIAPIPGSEVKSDYLAIYVDGDKFIVTLIEMKGRKDAEHAIRHKNVHRHVKEWVRDFLPTKMASVIIQAILLTPYNSYIPHHLIVDCYKNAGLSITPVQCSGFAELYQYVSKKNDPSSTYDISSIRNQRPSNMIEEILAHKMFKYRISDEVSRRISRKRDNLILYGGNNKLDYVALYTDNQSAELFFSTHCSFRNDLLELLKPRLQYFQRF